MGRDAYQDSLRHPQHGRQGAGVPQPGGPPRPLRAGLPGRRRPRPAREIEEVGAGGCDAGAPAPRGAAEGPRTDGALHRRGRHRGAGRGDPPQGPPVGMRHKPISVLAALAVSARGSTTPPAGDPSAQDGNATNAFVPDVPSWRGGCFFDGPSGKIVNASPSPDVRLFGGACATPASPGGIVFLDRHDPVTGTGDVAVLSADPGSVPVVVGPSGGAGGLIPGGTGARLNDAQTRLLTLSSVSFVTGQLVLVDLPRAASPQTIASGVRVENYDFLPGDRALFVGDYSATSRTGNLYYWPGAGSPQLIASQIARFDFNMYRLSPDRTRVAYLTSFTSIDGGNLFVQTLPPGAAATPVDTRVAGLSWTPDGRHLVYLVQEIGAPTFSLRVWDEAGATSTVQGGVNRAVLAGDQLLYLTGWSILAQQGTLHRRGVTDGADSFTATGASREYAALAPQGLAGGALAFTLLPSASDPFVGDLHLTSLVGAGGPGGAAGG